MDTQGSEWPDGRRDTNTMAKAPPSFDFYYNDWKGGTDHLTQEEKGCYLDLLIFQWQNGHIPREPLQRMGLCGITDLGSWERIWRHLEDKFECVGTYENTPLLANERMHEDRIRAIARWEKHRKNAEKNGKRGGRPKKTQPVSTENPAGFVGKPTSEGGRRKDLPLDTSLDVDASLTGNIPEGGVQGGKIPPSVEDVTAFIRGLGRPVDADRESDRYWNFYQSKGWMVGQNRMTDWQAAAKRWVDSEVSGGPHSKPMLSGEEIARAIEAIGGAE